MPPKDAQAKSAEERLALEQHRYSLPALLKDAQRDRASTAFAMEKLDQPAINELFEQRRTRRGGKSRK